MDQSRQLSEIWKEDIITKANFIENELNDLNPNDMDDHFRLICPACKDKKIKAFLYKNSDVIICNHKNTCGKKTPVLQYLHVFHGRGSSYPFGDEYVKEVKHWGEKYGIKFDEKMFKKAEENFKKVSRLQDLLKKFWNAIEPIRDPLTDSFIEKRHLQTLAYKYRYFTTVSEVVSKLNKAGFTPEDFQVIIDIGMLPTNYANRPKMHDWHWEQKILGCNLARSGNICGFWGRTLNYKPIENDNLPNYKERLNKWKKEKHRKSSLKNENNTQKALETFYTPYNAGDIRGDSINFVEGPFDVDSVVVAGLNNVVAMETKTPTKHHDGILKNKRYVTLFPDNDDGGETGTTQFIKEHRNADFNIFVVNPDSVEKGDDPNDVLVKYGPKHLRNLFNPENLISGHEFVARMMVNKHKGDEWNVVSQADCFRDFQSYAKGVEKASQTRSLCDCALPVLVREGVMTSRTQGLVADALIKEKDNAEAKATKEKYSELMKSKVEEISKLHAEGKIYKSEQAEKELSNLREEFNQKTSKSASQELRFISEMGDDWLDVEAPPKSMLLNFTEDDDRKIGYLPKGIVAMIPGPGGVGKTHLMAQFAISIATGNDLLTVLSPENVGAVFLGLGENNMDDLRRVIQKHCKMLNVDAKQLAKQNICPYSFHGINAAFIENDEASQYFYFLKKELIEKAPENGWELLIFDPISRLLGVGAENDNSRATRFISLLEQLTEEVPGNPTVLFAHHVNKTSLNNEEHQNQSAARGASALTDGCRWQVNFFSTEQNCYSLKMVKTNFTKVIKLGLLEKDVNGILKLRERSYVR
jgi:regulatory protein RepA